MFQFPRLPAGRLCVQRRLTPHYQRWVSPFGNPRINGYSAPTRGFSQPFTPFITPGAKASTVCPYYLDGDVTGLEARLGDTRSWLLLCSSQGPRRARNLRSTPRQ